MSPRLYLDEDVIPGLAPSLRLAGVDAVSCHEIGALSLSDEEQLARAALDDRALLTFNYHDFLGLSQRWLAQGRSHSGIIVSYHQYRREELSPLRRALLALFAEVSAENLRDATLILDSFR